MAKFKKAYPSAAQMGSGFPAFGADAVRFSLATYPPSNKRIALAPKRIEGNRHFLNKIWNATRLSLDLLAGYTWKEDAPAPRDFYNRWILSRLGRAIEIAHGGLANFRVDETANEAYRFFWNDFCDWYLEIAKTILRKNEDGSYPRAEIVPETMHTLAKALEASFRLMHPLMPFLTEELWQRVPRPASRKTSIAFGPYPEKEDAVFDPAIDRDMSALQAVIGAARTIRSEHSVDWKNAVPLILRSEKPDALAFLREHEALIGFLVKTEGRPVFEATGTPRPKGSTVSVAPTEHGPIEVIVGLKGLVTGAEQRERIARELKRMEKELAAIDKKLGSPGFVDRAPREVVEETSAQRTRIVVSISRLKEAATLADELD
jgi:valyl-tRNA synthetase